MRLFIELIAWLSMAISGEMDAPPQDSREIGRLIGHPGIVRTLAAHPRSDFMLSAGYDRSVRLWDINRKTCLGVVRLDSSVVAVKWHPDGTHFATLNYDG